MHITLGMVRRGTASYDRQPSAGLAVAVPLKPFAPMLEVFAVGVQRIRQTSLPWASRLDRGGALGTVTRQSAAER